MAEKKKKDEKKKKSGLGNLFRRSMIPGQLSGDLLGDVSDKLKKARKKKK